MGRSSASSEESYPSTAPPPWYRNIPTSVPMGSWSGTKFALHGLFFLPLLTEIIVYSTKYHVPGYTTMAFVLYGPILFFTVVTVAMGKVLGTFLSGGRKCQRVVLWPLGTWSMEWDVALKEEEETVQELLVTVTWGCVVTIAHLIFWLFMLYVSAGITSYFPQDFYITDYKWFATLARRCVALHSLLLLMNLLLPVVPMDISYILAKLLDARYQRNNRSKSALIVLVCGVLMAIPFLVVPGGIIYVLSVELPKILLIFMGIWVFLSSLYLGLAISQGTVKGHPLFTQYYGACKEEDEAQDERRDNKHDFSIPDTEDEEPDLEKGIGRASSSSDSDDGSGRKSKPDDYYNRNDDESKTSNADDDSPLIKANSSGSFSTTRSRSRSPGLVERLSRRKSTSGSDKSMPRRSSSIPSLRGRQRLADNSGKGEQQPNQKEGTEEDDNDDGNSHLDSAAAVKYGQLDIPNVSNSTRLSSSDNRKAPPMSPIQFEPHKLISASQHHQQSPAEKRRSKYDAVQQSLQPQAPASGPPKRNGRRAPNWDPFRLSKTSPQEHSGGAMSSKTSPKPVRKTASTPQSGPLRSTPTSGSRSRRRLRSSATSQDAPKSAPAPAKRKMAKQSSQSDIPEKPSSSRSRSLSPSTDGRKKKNAPRSKSSGPNSPSKSTSKRFPRKLPLSNDSDSDDASRDGKPKKSGSARRGRKEAGVAANPTKTGRVGGGDSASNIKASSDAASKRRRSSSGGRFKKPKDDNGTRRSRSTSNKRGKGRSLSPQQHPAQLIQDANTADSGHHSFPKRMQPLRNPESRWDAEPLPPTSKKGLAALYGANSTPRNSTMIPPSGPEEVRYPPNKASRRASSENVTVNDGVDTKSPKPKTPKAVNNKKSVTISNGPLSPPGTRLPATLPPHAAPTPVKPRPKKPKSSLRKSRISTTTK